MAPPRPIYRRIEPQGCDPAISRPPGPVGIRLRGLSTAPRKPFQFKSHDESGQGHDDRSNAPAKPCRGRDSAEPSRWAWCRGKRCSGSIRTPRPRWAVIYKRRHMQILSFGADDHRSPLRSGPIRVRPVGSPELRRLPPNRGARTSIPGMSWTAGRTRASVSPPSSSGAVERHTRIGRGSPCRTSGGSRTHRRPAFDSTRSRLARPGGPWTTRERPAGAMPQARRHRQKRYARRRGWRRGKR